MYNPTRRKLGRNDLSVEHTRVTVRQRAGAFRGGVKYDKEAFHNAWEYLALGSSNGENELSFAIVFAKIRFSKFAPLPLKKVNCLPTKFSVCLR